MALTDQIQGDGQLDAVSANLARRRSATRCRAKSGETGPLSPILPIEREVLRLLAEAVSNQDIAERLMVAVGT
jgi:DNA-binding NarL/FixJ family response regulator